MTPWWLRLYNFNRWSTTHGTRFEHHSSYPPSNTYPVFTSTHTSTVKHANIRMAFTFGHRLEDRILNHCFSLLMCSDLFHVLERLQMACNLQTIALQIMPRRKLLIRPLNFECTPIGVRPSFAENHCLGLQARDQTFLKPCPTLSD